MFDHQLKSAISFLLLYILIENVEELGPRGRSTVGCCFENFFLKTRDLRGGVRWAGVERCDGEFRGSKHYDGEGSIPRVHRSCFRLGWPYHPDRHSAISRVR